VNSSPGLEGIEAATGLDLAGKMIQKLERKLGWGRPAGQETAAEAQPLTPA
jgi:ribosomal protein S6--L-glutamate ligase